MYGQLFRKRSRLIRAFLLFCLLMLILRLTYIQVAQAHSLSDEAQKWVQVDRQIQGTRGTIYDRNNEKLAFTGVAYDINIDLDVFRAKDAQKNGDTPEEYARFLAPLLGENEQKLIQYMDFSNPDRRGAMLGPKGRKVDSSVNDKIEEMHKQERFKGITTIRTDIRQYPNGQFASHVLGYFGMDSKGNETGLGGVEFSYNDTLAGKPGRALYYTDKQGNPLPMYQPEVKVPPVNGQDVVLTIDKSIQHYVEEELDSIVAKYKPKHASIIVADPNTGEILGMGNRPSFNPNTYAQTENPDALWENWALSGFEPGSTFKVFVLTGALAEHKLDLSETYQSGSIVVDGERMSDWNGTGWGQITYREGVYVSSNVGFIKIGQKLGKDALFQYINSFGFNNKTGIDLPNEGDSYLFNPAKMREVDLASTSFGQGISVTPIQQLAGLFAVANGGKVYQPHVVKEFRNPENGATVKEVKPKVLSTVANEETLSTVRQVLEETVNSEKDKPTSAYIKGYHVAGKTGTAQIPKKGGGYEDDKYRLSFMGFAPKDNPRVAIYVTVDQVAPGTAPLQFGSLVAEPAAKNVLEKTLRYMQVPIDPADGVTANDAKDANAPAQPQQGQAAKPAEPQTFVKVPDFIGTTPDQAKQLAQQGQLKLQSVGDGPKATSQWPDPSYGQVPAGTEVKLYFGPEGSKEGKVKVPDLRGLSMREAMETLALLQLEIEPKGFGYVSKQETPPGTLVPFGTKIKLEFAPQS